MNSSVDAISSQFAERRVVLEDFVHLWSRSHRLLFDDVERMSAQVPKFSARASALAFPSLARNLSKCFVIIFASNLRTRARRACACFETRRERAAPSSSDDRPLPSFSLVRYFLFRPRNPVLFGEPMKRLRPNKKLSFN